MVDRVELGLREQRHEGRILHGHHRRGLAEHREPSDEVVQVRDVRQHVVGHDQAGCPCSSTTSSAVRRPKNAVIVGTPAADAMAATFAAGSTPRTRTPERRELAQQVAVVAGDLDDAVRSRSSSSRPCLGVRLGVRQPRRADRGQVGVVPEDPLGPHELADLPETAGRADAQVQREERVGGVGVASSSLASGWTPRSRTETSRRAPHPRQIVQPAGRELAVLSVTLLLPRRSRSRSRAGARRARGRAAVCSPAIPVQGQADGRLPVQHAHPAQLGRASAESRVSSAVSA